MEPRYRIRVYLLTALVLVGFGALLTRLFDFQINKREFYQRQVPGNRQITVREPGIRGIIKDRNGIELARNRRNYEVSFNLDEIHQAYRLQRQEDPTRDVEGSEDGMPRKMTETDIVAIIKERVIPVLEPLGLVRDFNAEAVRTHYKTHGGLVPFTYTTDLNYDQFAEFAEHALEVPGVYLNVRPQREYPYKALSCHTLGFLRQWSKGDIPEDAARRYGYQYVGDEKGVAGVEATLDDLLRGSEGWKQIVKSEKGKILGEVLVDAIDPGVGAEVTLTIDAEIQYLLSNILRRAGTASGVVMDVQTGEILAMASVPDYDPNDFIPSISAAKNAEYESAKIKPLIDRTISWFPPGSTFKIPTALVGATKGFSHRSYHCSGHLAFGSYSVGCWIAQKGGSHGGLALPKAIQQSCNPYFMQLAGSIQTKGMVDGFAMLGFGEKTGVPLPGESPGLVTGSRAWQRMKPGAKVTPLDIGFLSIGQGNALATPLQLCAVAACVANGGRYYQPRLVKKALDRAGKPVLDSEGKPVIEDTPRLKVDLLKEGMKASDMDLIREGMRMAVNVPGGTAGRVKIPDYMIAAKTGTAQVSKPLDLHNAWTIAFGPFDQPRYAVCVLVENGKSGGAVCGPLVHLLFRGLKARDEGMKLPLHPLDPVVGNMDPIKEIALPEDVLAAIDVSQDDGETGDEVTNAAAAAGIIPGNPENSQPAITPRPTITPEADAEGTVTQPRRPARNR